MYNLATFKHRVRLANSSFTLKRSSLKALYKVLDTAHPGQANADDVLNAFKNINSRKKLRYQSALHYLLTNLGGEIQPQGFSWLTPAVGGMSKFDSNPQPLNAALWLYKNRVRTVISIEKNGAAITRAATREVFPRFEWYSCFLADWHAPSVKQLVRYCEKVQERLVIGRVATHCWGGTGRTGCFLAAYLIFNGDATSAQQAFTMVRNQYNQHSVEMKAQYNVLARLSDHMGNPPSLDYDDPGVDHAQGHWHAGHMNDGINQDPGHVGNGGAGGVAVFKTLVAAAGAGKSHTPYVTSNPNSHAQVVPRR